MSPSARALALLVFVLGMVHSAVGRVVGDLYPAAGALGGPAHAWIVVPGLRLTRDSAEPWQLYHVPPRTGPMASEDGTIRPAHAARLVHRPERLAVSGEGGGTVWMVMEPADKTKPGVRAVLSLNAVRHELAELWRDEPEEFPSAGPSLSGQGGLVGLAAESWGLAALFDDRPAGGELSLQVLAGRDWTRVPLPTLPASGSVSLTAGVSGPTVVSLVAGVLVEVFRCEPSRSKAGDLAGVDWSSPPSWSRDVLPVSTGAAGLTNAAKAAWRDSGTGLTVAWPRSTAKDSEVIIAELLRAGPLEFAAVTGEGRPAVAFMGPRAVVFWHQAAKDLGTPPRLAVAEVSLLTGRALYSGAAHAGLPITGSDVRLLLLTLTLLAASVFVFVIRTDAARAELTLPEGYSLAEPSTRVFASLLDVLLVVVVSTRITGISLGQLLTIKVAAGSEFIQFALTVAVCGALQGFVLEAVFGRTVGKALTGLVVARVVPGGIEAATFWSALVRNLVKWLLLPVGLLGLMEHNARHRGDVWARTAVVTATPSPDNSEDDE